MVICFLSCLGHGDCFSAKTVCLGVTGCTYLNCLVQYNAFGQQLSTQIIGSKMWFHLGRKKRGYMFPFLFSLQHHMMYSGQCRFVALPLHSERMGHFESSRGNCLGESPRDRSSLNCHWFCLRLWMLAWKADYLPVPSFLDHSCWILSSSLILSICISPHRFPLHL